MSESSPSDSPEEERLAVPTERKVGIFRKLSDGVALTDDDLKAKVKELAKGSGKSEKEVLEELVMKGMASTDEELTYLMARKRVLGSLTLDEVEMIMKKVGGVFGTWTTTPQPQPSIQPREERKDGFTQMMEGVEQRVMEGLPPVTYGKEQQPAKVGSMSNPLIEGMVKYLGDMAIEAFKEGIFNPSSPIGKAIAKVIEEKGAGFLDDLKNKFDDGGMV